MTYREDPLGVTLGPHVGVVNLLQDHPRLVVLPVLGEEHKHVFRDAEMRSNEQTINNPTFESFFIYFLLFPHLSACLLSHSSLCFWMINVYIFT